MQICVVLRVVQQQLLSCGIPLRGFVMHRELRIFVIQLRIHHNAMHHFVCDLVWYGCRDLPLQADGALVLQEIKRVRVGRPASVIALRASLALAVLELDARDVRLHCDALVACI